MPSIVVYNEARRPLTRKRIFELKLKDVPLCVTYDHMLNNLDLLIEAEFLAMLDNVDGDGEGNGKLFEAKRKTHIVFTPKVGEKSPELLTFDIGRQFILQHDQIWKVM